MPAFREYQPLDKALRELGLSYGLGDFITPLVRPVNPDLGRRLQALNLVGYLNSEAAITEAVVFPILQEVWLGGYQDVCQLWNQPWLASPDLQGEPDYVLTRLTPRGRVFTAPFAAIVEAKEESFRNGWGQCLAAMVTAQRLNGAAASVFGVVTIGTVWQFGKLDGTTFTRNAQHFDIIDLDQVCGAVRYVFDQVSRIEVPATPPLSR